MGIKVCFGFEGFTTGLPVGDSSAKTTLTVAFALLRLVPTDAVFACELLLNAHGLLAMVEKELGVSVELKGLL